MFIQRQQANAQTLDFMSEVEDMALCSLDSTINFRAPMWKDSQQFEPFSPSSNLETLKPKVEFESRKVAGRWPPTYVGHWQARTPPPDVHDGADAAVNGDNQQLAGTKRSREEADGAEPGHPGKKQHVEGASDVSSSPPDRGVPPLLSSRTLPH